MYITSFTYSLCLSLWGTILPGIVFSCLAEPHTYTARGALVLWRITVILTSSVCHNGQGRNIYNSQRVHAIISRGAMYATTIESIYCNVHSYTVDVTPVMTVLCLRSETIDKKWKGLLMVLCRAIYSICMYTLIMRGPSYGTHPLYSHMAEWILKRKPRNQFSVW